MEAAEESKLGLRIVLEGNLKKKLAAEESKLGLRIVLEGNLKKRSEKPRLGSIIIHHASFVIHHLPFIID